MRARSISCVYSTEGDRLRSEATYEMAVFPGRVFPDRRLVAAAGFSAARRQWNGVRGGNHQRVALDPSPSNGETTRLTFNDNISRIPECCLTLSSVHQTKISGDQTKTSPTPYASHITVSRWRSAAIGA
jgi:hypothetical protein